jgi:hypothetical protein
VVVDGGLSGRLLAIVLAVLGALVPGGAGVSVPVADGVRGAGGAPGGACLAVGAWVPVEGEGFPVQAVATAERELGPLGIRRSFDVDLPASFGSSAAAGDPAAGVLSLVSWKPPGGDHRGAAAGAYDEEISAWARSVPRTGVYATSFHEPENDMTAAEFVAFQRHLHTVVTRANPTIRWGPVYMAHWWDPAEPDQYVGDPAAWWPGAEHADFAGLDWYGAEPTAMTTSSSFLHWYGFMAGTGSPLVIAEYGQAVVRPGEQLTAARSTARAAAIRADAAWLADHPQVVAWLYWHGPGPRGDWRLTDEPSRAAWRAAATAGCP